MKLSEIIKRLAEIAEELTKLKARLEEEDVDVDDVEEKSNKLIEERDGLLAQKKELEGKAEKRQSLLDKIASGQVGTVIRDNGDRSGANSNDKLYRSAWLKNLQGKEMTAEERAAYTHTTENSGALIPTETANKIYSTLGQMHPIVADVKRISSGGIFRMVRHIAIVAGDAKVVAEGTANDDEQNTFVEVLLAGKKISKHIVISHELMSMSIDAFEAYIADELAKRIEKAMADSIIATIKDATNNDNGKGKGLHKDNLVKSTKGLGIDTVLEALSKLNEVGTTYVYANRADIYGAIAMLANKNQTVNFVTDMSEAVKGNLLGNGIKQEDSLAKGEILILDPAQFLWNDVAPLEILRDREVKTGNWTVAAHVVGDGALENQKAGALITFTGTPSI